LDLRIRLSSAETLQAVSGLPRRFAPRSPTVAIAVSGEVAVDGQEQALDFGGRAYAIRTASLDDRFAD
jgi:hypothetical protein